MNILSYVHLRRLYRATGVGRFARNVIEELALLGQDDIRVLADRRDHNFVVEKIGAPWTAFRYYLFSSSTSHQQLRWILLDRPVAERIWPEVELVYCVAESYVPTRRARSVVTLHDVGIFENANWRWDRHFITQRAKWMALFRKLDKRVDLFQTVSSFSAERIAHFFPTMATRLFVVPNGVAGAFFLQNDDGERDYLSRVNPNGGRFVFLPGGISFRKNADVVLRAWPIVRKEHSDLILVVTGEFMKEYASRIRALGDSVKVLGFVSDEGLRALYRAAEVVWFPSRYEGFGMPLLEAMACGAPVVASNTAAVPEVAGDAALLVSTDDPRAHARALHELLSDDAARIRFRIKGRERAARFTWARTAAELRTHLAALR